MATTHTVEKEERLDRETFMLMRHRKLEAYEKAYEISVEMGTKKRR